MKGRFKGWLLGKSFGFIVPEDNSQDVFVHKSGVMDPAQLRVGDLVEFEVATTEKGVVAQNVVPFETVGARVRDSSERFRGCVTRWNERGYGFIRRNDDGGSIFVHSTSLPHNCNGYLAEGDIVEFRLAMTERGEVAGDVEIVGWEAPKTHLFAFADMGGPAWPVQLCELAEEEPWEYRHAQASESMPILRSYLRHTFQRLREMPDGIGKASDGSAAAFNTGLVTPNQEELYAFFLPNRRAERQKWSLHKFMKASDRDFINKFGASLPPLANYFSDPSVLLYDRRRTLVINIDHVMEQIERFPKHLQENMYVARGLLASAEVITQKRVYRNYKAAIPQYFRDKGGSGSIQLLLPICLENPRKADLALVVETSDNDSTYRGSTVLTLDMAYNNARLLARPDTEWLQP